MNGLLTRTEVGPRPDWMPRKPLSAGRAWRLERAAHRRFMRRSAARGALATTDPGYRRAARLTDEAYAHAKAIRRRVWGSRA